MPACFFREGPNSTSNLRDNGATRDTICGDSGADKREELDGVSVGFWIAAKPSTIKAVKTKRAHRHAERWGRFKVRLRAKVEHPSASSATPRCATAGWRRTRRSY